MSRTDTVDTFLMDNPHIALLVRQVEELMKLHNRLVAEGRLPAYFLMGIHNNYSATQKGG